MDQVETAAWKVEAVLDLPIIGSQYMCKHSLKIRWYENCRSVEASVSEA